MVSCSSANALEDAVEITTTGGTSLRWDTTAHQFIQNWRTPATAGKCYVVFITKDSASLSAYFKIK